MSSARNREVEMHLLLDRAMAAERGIEVKLIVGHLPSFVTTLGKVIREMSEAYGDLSIITPPGGSHETVWIVKKEPDNA